MRTAAHLISLFLPLWASVVLTTPAAAQSQRESTERYVEVLRTLADGDRDAALEALAELESKAVDASNPTPSLERLADAELRVARRLARRDPDALPPLLDLHVHCHSAYWYSRQLLLLQHARSTVVALTELYVRTGHDNPDAKPLASWVLTDLGNNLLHSRSRPLAETVLEQAAKLDELNGRARLGLAAIYEKTSRYEEAAAVLQVAHLPASLEPEGRLRLAINQARLGNLSSAAAQLQTLIRSPQPEWVSSLAHQELARLLFDAEDFSAASILLSDAVKRFPTDQRLAIQLSYALERKRQPRAAQAAVAKVAAASSRSEWPRDRYNRFPAIELTPAERSGEEEWIDKRLNNLGAALTALEGVNQESGS